MIGRYGGLDMTEYLLASLVRAHSWKTVEGEQQKHVKTVQLPAL
jgi:hypothetical protein